LDKAKALELALGQIQHPVEGSVERPPRDRTSQPIESKGPRAPAMEIARQLVEQQHARERGPGVGEEFARRARPEAGQLALEPAAQRSIGLRIG
jgi:hypothetical protein